MTVRQSFGHCSHERHYKEEISESTFEYKGCWNCQQFNPGEGYDLLDIKQAAEILNVSSFKVHSLIRKGKLEAELFERGRDSTFDGGLILGARKKYFIRKEVLNNFGEQRIKREREKDEDIVETKSEIREEIETLKKGLEIRKNYAPDNPVLLMIKKRLKVLEMEARNEQ